MPTTRPRHMITETDEIVDALDAAALLWPELRDDRAALLRRVILRGAETIEPAADRARSERRRAIHETSGMFTGMWPAGEAARLKLEWPE